ncbi:hypothetical protein ACHAXR_009032 [Thalassiosira sp. AJA248-18]
MCRWSPLTLLLACASWRHCLRAAYGFSLERRTFAPISVASSPSMATAAINLDATSSSAAAILYFYSNLDTLYDRSSAIKCPFFRRRAADLIDNAAMVLQFLLIRHKSLPGISDLFLTDSPADEMSSLASTNSIMDVFSAPGCKPLGRHIKRNTDGTAQKTLHLPIEDISQRVHDNWTGGVAGKDKGYYITGKLDSTIYRDDCFFTGPDPDMPVRGLRKYLSAAAHLFDPRESNAEMLSIKNYDNAGEKGYGMIEVKWRLGGVIQLPWHPKIEPWTGTTFYHLDEKGLIFLHQEEWDISVWRAFICTLYPQARGWMIWDLEEQISIHV